MIYNFPFYPHFPTKSYRTYPHSINKASSIPKYDTMRYNNNNFNKYSNLEPTRYKHTINRSNFTYNHQSNNASDLKKTQSFSKNHSSNSNNNINSNTCNSNIEHKDRYDSEYFEILGIKLYSDDILLLCLIFFLYKEGVKDEYLFISLIMLLLS